MKFRTFYKVLPLIFCVFIFCSCTQKPDVIYTNGKIHTMDDKNSVVEAVAIKDGKIIETGTSLGITDKYGSENSIDLEGKVVLPGFIDCDGALVEFSKNLSFINLAGAKNVTEVLLLVNSKVSKDSNSEWIGGYGWNDMVFSEDDLMNIDKTQLDAISSKQNIYLVNLSGNAVWVNSKLLQTAGITKDTPSPPGGEIVKDETGEPIGLLLDSAVNIIKEKVPETTRDEIKKFVEAGSQELMRYGITEVQDRTLSGESIGVLKELINENKLPIRVYAVLAAGFPVFEEYMNKGIEVNYKDKLTVRSVSVDYDGALEIQDAAMKNPYFKDPKKKTPYNTESEIENYFRRAREKNFQFRVKAVGDEAVTSSLNAMERVLRELDPKDHRTILEQAEFINPQDLARIKQYNITPSVRPDINMTDIMYVPLLTDSANVNNLGLWSSLLQSAGKITAGSDFPFHQINPFIQLYYLTARQFIDTNQLLPGANQKISLEDAIKAYTIWAAYSSFEETYKGSIEKDKFADMIVLSEDIFSDNKKLLTANVLKTIINGKVLYEFKGNTVPAGK